MSKEKELADTIDRNLKNVDEAYATLVGSYSDFYEEMLSLNYPNAALVLLHHKNLLEGVESSLMRTFVELMALFEDKSPQEVVDEAVKDLKAAKNKDQLN